MPHIEALRTGGLQMTQAYAASPVCGTSRYSTITGKMPSRAASVREKNQGENPAVVTIPTTKLEDTDDQNDCSSENLAAAFSDAEYATAMVGKWHLSGIDKSTYTYASAVDTVKQCGFDFVGGTFCVLWCIIVPVIGLMNGLISVRNSRK
jgi:arylsulfatase A-like enzyme